MIPDKTGNPGRRDFDNKQQYNILVMDCIP